MRAGARSGTSDSRRAGHRLCTAPWSASFPLHQLTMIASLHTDQIHMCCLCGSESSTFGPLRLLKTSEYDRHGISTSAQSAEETAITLEKSILSYWAQSQHFTLAVSFYSLHHLMTLAVNSLGLPECRVKVSPVRWLQNSRPAALLSDLCTDACSTGPFKFHALAQ